jgi:hypothetical protein
MSCGCRISRANVWLLRCNRGAGVQLDLFSFVSYGCAALECGAGEHFLSRGVFEPPPQAWMNSAVRMEPKCSHFGAQSHMLRAQEPMLQLV